MPPRWRGLRKDLPAQARHHRHRCRAVPEIASISFSCKRTSGGSLLGSLVTSMGHSNAKLINDRMAQEAEPSIRQVRRKRDPAPEVRRASKPNCDWVIMQPTILSNICDLSEWHNDLLAEVRD